MTIVVQQVPFVLWAPLAWSWALLWYCLSRRAIRWLSARMGRSLR